MGDIEEISNSKDVEDAYEIYFKESVYPSRDLKERIKYRLNFMPRMNFLRKAAIWIVLLVVPFGFYDYTVEQDLMSKKAIIEDLLYSEEALNYVVYENMVYLLDDYSYGSDSLSSTDGEFYENARASLYSYILMGTSVPDDVLNTLSPTELDDMVDTAAREQVEFLKQETFVGII